MLQKLIVFFLVAGFLFLGIDELIAQCSQCKLLAEQSAADDEILGAKSTTINSAILYIMAIPYIILMILFRKQISTLLKKVTKSA
jgi:hypothetical protein